MVNHRDRTQTLIVAIRRPPSRTMKVVQNRLEHASPGGRQIKCPESGRSYALCNMENVINKLTKEIFAFTT